MEDNLHNQSINIDEINHTPQDATNLGDRPVNNIEVNGVTENNTHELINESDHVSEDDVNESLDVMNEYIANDVNDDQQATLIDGEPDEEAVIGDDDADDLDPGGTGSGINIPRENN